MSNNAIDAYDQGLKPLSKITAKDLKNHGINITLKQFKELCNENEILPAEWHHTSSRYNRTYFYNLDDCKKQLENITITDTPKKTEEVYSAHCTWVDWSGSRNHPKATDREGVALIKGNWATLTTGKRKKVSGNYFIVGEKLDQIPEELQKFIK